MKSGAKNNEAFVSRARRAARRTLVLMGYPPDAADIFFLQDSEMRAVKRATVGVRSDFVDVLAFEEPKQFPHPERGTLLGEVYINAEHYRTKPEQMCALIVHGILHLLGFRHAGRRATIEMRRKEQALLMQLNQEKSGGSKNFTSRSNKI